jgi:starch phosphorylase
VHSIQRQIANHIEYTLASSRFDFDQHKAYLATARSVRDRLIESWNDTNTHFDEMQVKRVAYLSLEFLMGRSMQNALLNMDLESSYRKAVSEVRGGSGPGCDSRNGRAELGLAVPASARTTFH